MRFHNRLFSPIVNILKFGSALIGKKKLCLRYFKLCQTYFKISQTYFSQHRTPDFYVN